MSAEQDFETWIETETIGPPRALLFVLYALGVMTALVWTVALPLLGVMVSR
jgi:hypothetical protein